MKKIVLTMLCLFLATSYGIAESQGKYGATKKYLKRVGTDIIPSANITYDLGSSTRKFTNLYADSVNVSTITQVTVRITGTGQVVISTATGVDTWTMAAGGGITTLASITAGTSFIIGSADMNETDLEKLDGITNGTAAANKCLVVDGNIDIGTIRNITMTGALTVGEDTIFTPDRSLSVLEQSSTVIVTHRFMIIKSSGNLVVLTNTPTITDATDGQIVTFIGNSDTDTVTFQDESNLGNSDLQLSGGNDFTFGLGDTLTLMYDGTEDEWFELSRSDN